jgi:uncharacterized protein
MTDSRYICKNITNINRFVSHNFHMDTLQEYSLLAGLAVAAFLYASVGHGGASGYLAVMAFAGLSPATMKPAALALNIVVAGIGSWKYLRAGAFDWRVFWPFAVVSIPMAYVGGTLEIPGSVFKPLVGVALLFAAWRMVLSTRRTEVERRKLQLIPAFAAGAAIGLLSGLTGVGGGIFLSPLVLLLGWAGTRETSGIAALFILVNSVAALAGHGDVSALPQHFPLWMAVVAVLGWLGAEFGSRRFRLPVIRNLLAVVLALAGTKMILTA